MSHAGITESSLVSGTDMSIWMDEKHGACQ